MSNRKITTKRPRDKKIRELERKPSRAYDYDMPMKPAPKKPPPPPPPKKKS